VTPCTSVAVANASRYSPSREDREHALDSASWILGGGDASEVQRCTRIRCPRAAASADLLHLLATPRRGKRIEHRDRRIARQLSSARGQRSEPRERLVELAVGEVELCAQEVREFILRREPKRLAQIPLGFDLSICHEIGARTAKIGREATRNLREERRCGRRGLRRLAAPKQPLDLVDGVLSLRHGCVSDVLASPIAGLTTSNA